MSKIAFIFPGQGSQYVGMGKDLYEKYSAARTVFDEFNLILGKNLSEICFEGNEEDLKQTINSQPAILAVSMAAYEAFKAKSNIVPDFLAGHSLGEYAALYASGVINRSEIIKLVQKRAELMNEAQPGSMSAILGMDEDKIQQMIQEASSEGTICAANYNTPDQTVISGETKAVEKANELAKEMGAKRVIPLAVSGAFHSPLMKPVADKFARFVNNTNVNDGNIPVVTNVDANPTIDKAEFSSKMVKQIYSSVYWKQTINFMVEQGVDTFIEIGPGKVLSGMIKKICKTAKVCNISDVESLEKVLSEYVTEVGV
jgi:[acyl-carrier-protein] S-malonyltransferase